MQNGAPVIGSALLWLAGWPARRRAARARLRSELLDAFAHLASEGATQMGWTAPSIRKHVEARTRGAVRLHRGNLYPAIRALEADGYLESWEADPTIERGGRPRRYYRLTAQGRAAAGEGRPS